MSVSVNGINLRDDSDPTTLSASISSSSSPSFDIEVNSTTNLPSTPFYVKIFKEKSGQFNYLHSESELMKIGSVSGTTLTVTERQVGDTSAHDFTSSDLVVVGNQMPVSEAYYDSGEFDGDFDDKTTDDLSEGSTNLYYTDSRVNEGLANIIHNGSHTASGDDSQKAFNIPHNFSGKPTAWFVDPVTDDASSYSHLSADDTNMTVHYDTPPPSGTDNLVYNWLAINFDSGAYTQSLSLSGLGTGSFGMEEETKSIKSIASSEVIVPEDRYPPELNTQDGRVKKLSELREGDYILGYSGKDYIGNISHYASDDPLNNHVVREFAKVKAIRHSFDEGYWVVNQKKMLENQKLYVYDQQSEKYKFVELSEFEANSFSKLNSFQHKLVKANDLTVGSEPQFEEVEDKCYVGQSTEIVELKLDTNILVRDQFAVYNQ